MIPLPPRSTLFPYTTLFRSVTGVQTCALPIDRKSGSAGMPRSEERFSRNAETDLVCRLLFEKKKNGIITHNYLLIFNFLGMIVIYINFYIVLFVFTIDTSHY